MASNKLYRSFIILQEDERGHSVSNDKPLSGYAKIEAKGEKCKIAFYAQNLKSADEKCHMALVCNKKDGNFILDLGLMNINSQGKAEASLECSTNNIGNLDIGYDKIIGAVIYKEIGGKVIYLMCGFLNGQQPKENWKLYNILSKHGLMKKSQSSSKKNEEEHNTGNEVKEGNSGQRSASEDVEVEVTDESDDNVEKEENVEEVEATLNNGTRGEETNNTLDKNVSQNVEVQNVTDDIESENRFDEYENLIEAKINGGNYEREADENYSELESQRTVETVEIKLEDSSISESRGEGQIVDEETTRENIKEVISHIETAQQAERAKQIEDTKIAQDTKTTEGIQDNKNIEMEDTTSKIEQPKEQGVMHGGYKAWQGDTTQGRSVEAEKIREKIFEEVEEEFELTGSTAEFFSSVVNGFEYTRGFAKDVKKCKWYKVKVDNFDVLCNMSNYNKYTVAYYPMINYYPYICRKGYFMIGFKYDENGVVKYVTYAIPGYKDKKDQPYGGKTGFVTWCPEFKNSIDGHWIMFYDFQNSKVLVPIV